MSSPVPQPSDVLTIGEFVADLRRRLTQMTGVFEAEHVSAPTRTKERWEEVFANWVEDKPEDFIP